METYVCVKCLDELPAERFTMQRHRRTGKLYRAKACKKCVNRHDYEVMRRDPVRYAKYLERGKRRGKNRPPRKAGRRERMIAVLRKHGLFKESSDAT